MLLFECEFQEENFALKTVSEVSNFEHIMDGFYDFVSTYYPNCKEQYTNEFREKFRERGLEKLAERLTKNQVKNFTDLVGYSNAEEEIGDVIIDVVADSIKTGLKVKN